MNTPYRPDNTGKSLVVLLGLAFVAVLIALVIGLSDKPDVQAIGVAAGPVNALPVVAPAIADTFGFDADDDAAATTEGAPVEAQESDTGLPAPITSDDAAAADDTTSAEAGANDGNATTSDIELSEEAEERLGDTEVIVVPTAEPSPTPEIAAAVEPTPTPAPDAAEDPDDAAPVPSLPTSSGTIQGAFFTKVDENEGAVVAQNLISISFAEDGTGAFQGVLEILYPDETRILLNMSGPLVFAPTNPQVEETLTGAFTLDAPIDADDITAADAELSISSLSAGSGSLCTSKCFGFTFPPQTGP